jgi:hypothetical protein
LEVAVIFAFSELKNFFVGTWLLRAELVAGEAKDF